MKETKFYIENQKEEKQQPPEVLYEKNILKNVVNFTGKCVGVAFFLLKLQVSGLRYAKLITKKVL